MQKILAIAWLNVYTTFTDRNLLFIMLLTPLALATIIGTAFSGFFNNSGSDVPLRDIAIAVVSEDVPSGGFDGGQIFIDALVPPVDASTETLENNALFQLTDTVVLATADEARAGVDSGIYRAAILIPADFSARIAYTQEHPTVEAVMVNVYASPAAPISGNVARSIAAGIANRIAADQIAVAATLNALQARAQTNLAFGIAFGTAAGQGDFQPDFQGALGDAIATEALTIAQQTVAGAETTFNPLVVFGSGQAIFFMLFTAMGSAANLLEEKRDGTLQRMIVSPTARATVLAGKLFGTFLMCCLQVMLLFIALTGVGSLLQGSLSLIWGDNIPLILLLIVAAAFGASGIGILVTAFSRTPEQANIVGGVVSLANALFGGVFFSVATIPLLAPLSRLTIPFWGVNGFTTLATGGTDILPNVLVLTLIGAVGFIVGVTVFTRRLEF